MYVTIRTRNIAMPHYDRLINIFQTLIAFRTISKDFDEVAACLTYIEELSAPYGLTVRRYTSNGFQSLVLSTQDTTNPTVLLQAHIDVVPAYDHQFSLQQKDGKLYGRGVYDMKFAAACFLYLLEDMKEDLVNYDFAIMLTSDEELDGRNGVDYLLNQGYGADVCILPDSGEEWNIEAGAKGFATAEITVKGSSAHGSRPWEADNAGIKLAHFVLEVQKEFAHSSRLDTTTTPTLLSAGSAHNQIPGDATATFDIRFPTDTAYRQTKKRFERLCRQHDIEVQFTTLAEAIEHQLDNEYMELWQAVTTQVTGRNPTFTRSFAASDARYLVPRGISTISARPRGGGHHGGEEWLEEKDFYEFYEVVKSFVCRASRTAD